MATYRESLVQKDELEQRIAQKREEELREVIASIRQQMTEYGLTLKD
jgi:DNA-binding protein H-NS